MKKYIGLVILLIAFVCCMGCTQTQVPEVVTTPATTVPTTIPTEELTLATITLPTSVVTTMIPVSTRTTSPSNKVVTTISMRNNTFVPQELTALPGTGIIWINEDHGVHTVTSIGNTTGKLNSGDILPASQWSYTFGQREGRYEFTCLYHPEMKGAIIIKNP